MAKINMQRFDLSVIRPVKPDVVVAADGSKTLKGKPGELVFEMTVTDESITKAVAYVKSLLGPESDLLVLQTASVIRDKVIDPELRSAILKKLGINDPVDYDRVKAEVEYKNREAKLDALEEA